MISYYNNKNFRNNLNLKDLNNEYKNIKKIKNKNETIINLENQIKSKNEIINNSENQIKNKNEIIINLENKI